MLAGSFVLASALGLGACGNQYDDGGRCPEFEPIRATPVAVFDIAGVDLFARGPRSLFEEESEGRYDRITTDETLAADDLRLSITSSATLAATGEARSRPTPRPSSIGPPGPSVETNTRLVDITVTSDERWNESHPAGRALQGVTVVLEARSVVPLSVTELPEYLEGARFGATLRSYSLKAEPIRRLGDCLLLRLTPPDAERRLPFEKA